MLSDFFRINLPYGIAKNENGEWMAFNREYLPLGYNDLNMKGMPGESYLDIPVYTNYKAITEKLLIELAGNEKYIQRNENRIITKVFLYNDGTNPMNQKTEKKDLWDIYFQKIQKLSRLRIQ